MPISGDGGGSTRDASGGMTYGGHVPGIDAYAPTATGGMRHGGSTPPLRLFATIGATGGMRHGGSTPGMLGTGDISPSGGISLGGSESPSAGMKPAPSGGISLGGHVGTLVAFSFSPSGGIRFGGSLVAGGGPPLSGHGGMTYGGRPSPMAGYTKSPIGGLIFGGHTPPTTGSSHVSASGGMRFGGSPFLPGVWYHVYENHGIGDAVDYDFAVQTTSFLSWTTPALMFPGDYSFHVRAFYLTNGLEEHNLDARIRVVLDASGIDVTGRPAPPTGLSAVPIKGGQVRLTWQYKTPSGRASPSKFNVYSGTPAVSYGSPTMMIAYGSDGRNFAVVTGLTDGDSYQFVVRAANATAEEPNTNIVTAVADSSGPNPPQFLVATAI